MASVPFPTNTGGAGDFYQSSFGPPPGAAPGAPGAPPGGAAPPPGGGQQDPAYYMPPPQQSTSSFEDEPPLLEELGINLPAVLEKAKLVANPFSQIDSTFADDADMTGPVVFCLALGFLLLLQGKVQFGVIYGQATVGCLAVYFLFNLMSTRGIDLYRSTSILGYALLPMVLLSLFAVIPMKKLKALGIVLGGACIFWSTTTASKIFVAVLALDNMFWLVWYPLALLYTSFAFITVF